MTCWPGWGFPRSLVRRHCSNARATKYIIYLLFVIHALVSAVFKIKLYAIHFISDGRDNSYYWLPALFIPDVLVLHRPTFPCSWLYLGTLGPFPTSILPRSGRQALLVDAPGAGGVGHGSLFPWGGLDMCPYACELCPLATWKIRDRVSWVLGLHGTYEKPKDSAK